MLESTCVDIGDGVLIENESVHIVVVRSVVELSTVEVSSFVEDVEKMFTFVVFGKHKTVTQCERCKMKIHWMLCIPLANLKYTYVCMKNVNRIMAMIILSRNCQEYNFVV